MVVVSGLCARRGQAVLDERAITTERPTTVKLDTYLSTVTAGSRTTNRRSLSPRVCTASARSHL